MTDSNAVDPLQQMHRDIAVVCSDKLYRIRQLVQREPATSLVNRILQILDEPLQELP